MLDRMEEYRSRWLANPYSSTLPAQVDLKTDACVSNRE